MADIERIRVIWSGIAGMPGVSTFYSLDAAAVLAPLRTFFVAVAGAIPTGCSLQIQADGDKINDATGDLIGSWAGDAQAVVNGGEGGNYAAPAGCSVQWLTEAVVNSHRVKGRTYIVPIGASQFQDDGTIGNTFVTNLTAAAQALVDDTVGNFLVWHRPGGAPVSTGAGVPISGVRVADKAVVLRSRRD